MERKRLNLVSKRILKKYKNKLDFNHTNLEQKYFERGIDIVVLTKGESLYDGHDDYGPICVDYIVSDVYVYLLYKHYITGIHLNNTNSVRYPIYSLDKDTKGYIYGKLDISDKLDKLKYYKLRYFCKIVDKIVSEIRKKLITKILKVNITDI